MNLQNIKRIFPYAKPYAKYAYLNVLFNTLYALFSALSFVALIPMLDVLFGNKKQITQAPTYTNLATLKEYLYDYLAYKISTLAQGMPVVALGVIIALVLVLFLLKNLFNYLAIININYLRNGVLKDLRNTLYRKIIALPIGYFTEKRKGDLLSRITGDVNEFQHSYLSILELIVREPLTILFTITIMCGISLKLTLFVFVFIPTSGIIISKIGKSLKKYSHKAQQEQGFFLSLIEESIGGLKVIKSFHSEGIFTQRFENSTQRLLQMSNALSNRQNLASPTSEFLGILTIGVLLWFGGTMVLVDKTLSGAEFIAYMGLAYNILTPAKSISKASYQLRQGDAAADRVMEIIEAENTLLEAPNAIDKSSFEKSISIKNISFKYHEQMVIRELSLEIPKGKTIALVGQSGSGKSTLASLLTRFYDLEEGEIRIDDTNIKDISTHSLCGLIGTVWQDSTLFNDSIKNNLLLGKPHATDEELIAAAKVANALDFIENTPNGFLTNIGDAGSLLSGGQKQRLCIARAVLKNPPIMILDEATSALDTESEKLVQQALENMMKNRTSIVIAHRLSTVQNADLIVVLEKGQIVEQGNHQSLMAKGGTYRKLVEMQQIS